MELLRQLTKRAAAQVVAEENTPAWEELRQAMEEDYRPTSKAFWQTVQCLRKGKQCPANVVYSDDRKLLSWTGDIIQGPP